MEDELITIKDIYGKELLTLDVNSLSWEDLSGANLRGADLSEADLRGADLRGADMIIITWHPWNVFITTNHIRIGCQSHSLQEWKNFSDEEIFGMHENALEFWKLNKELIIGLCERFEAKYQ